MSPSSLHPFPTTGAFEPYLEHLAHLVAEHGITSFEGDIARLVVRFHAAGHLGPLVDLLADKHAPAVARERAFGTLLPLLTSDRRRHADTDVEVAATHAA